MCLAEKQNFHNVACFLGKYDSTSPSPRSDIGDVVRPHPSPEHLTRLHVTGNVVNMHWNFFPLIYSAKNCERYPSRIASADAQKCGQLEVVNFNYSMDADIKHIKAMDRYRDTPHIWPYNYLGVEEYRLTIRVTISLD